MTTTTDDADDLGGLVGWLAAQVGDRALEVRGLDLPEGVGHSSETLALELVHGDGSTEGVVVRFAPTGPAVFPTYDLGVQVAALRAARRRSAAPVPEVRFEDLAGDAVGRPLYVMERVVGDVPADRLPYTMVGWLLESTPEVQASVWWTTIEAMAALHRGDWAAADLTALDRSTHGPAGLRQQLAWWEGYATWVGRGRAQPTIDGGLAWLHAHLPATPPPTGLVWGDARISNTLYRDGRAVALLDWEMAALGPAELDLAWFLFFADFFSTGLGVEDLPGFPGRASTLERYEELLGRPLDDLAWYEAFAAWRHTAIMARIADLWTEAGDLPAGNVGRDNNPASRMLAEMLDLPSPGDAGGPLG